MADNFPIKDGAGASQQLRSKDIGNSTHVPFHALASAAGTPIDASNALPVALDAATLAALESVTVAGPVTNAELRAAPVSVRPVMTSGGNLAAVTSVTGAPYVAFAAQPCSQITIVNESGTRIEFQRGGAGAAVPVRDGAALTIFGIGDASQIAVRRADTSNTQVTVHATWEA